MAACATQRPELFGAVVAHVGVYDMLRFHRFTIGSAWVTEYGCADAGPGECAVLRAYSPLHTVRPAGDYPATLLLTASHDDRVVSLHSLKLVATMQHAARGAAAAGGGARRPPIVARIDIKSGHGAGKPTAKVIDEAADVYAFVAQALGVQWRG